MLTLLYRKLHCTKHAAAEQQKNWIDSGVLLNSDQALIRREEMSPMRDDERPITEDRATQPMEAGGWVSRWKKFIKLYFRYVDAISWDFLVKETPATKMCVFYNLPRLLLLLVLANEHFVIRNERGERVEPAQRNSLQLLFITEMLK